MAVTEAAGTPPIPSEEKPNAAGLSRDARMERASLIGLCSPAFFLVFLIMILPVAWLFWLSFLDNSGAFTLEHYERMISRKSYGRIFWATFEVSLLTTGICILIGYPLSYFLSQLPPRALTICMIAVLLPFWTSLLVRTYAWLVLLQRKG
ncbi:MAG: ABC transporter permease, partial [Pseudomonadota bacterium]